MAKLLLKLIQDGHNLYSSKKSPFKNNSYLLSKLSNLKKDISSSVSSITIDKNNPLTLIYPQMPSAIGLLMVVNAQIKYSKVVEFSKVKLYK